MIIEVNDTDSNTGKVACNVRNCNFLYCVKQFKKVDRNKRWFKNCLK